MTTDREHAAVIRRVLNNDDYVHLDDERAAYQRAIELLETKPRMRPQRERKHELKERP